MADDASLPSPGDVLVGKYKIERLLGRGGMGAVFAAQHILLNQRVAVKLLLGELSSSVEATNRFMNEARAAAQIQGEHVARVLDIGQLPTGTPYMVLEYLEGTDLSGLVQQRGVLSVPEVADYAIQALEALGQAHAAGIVHRDLKPANLFLARRHDGTSVVKVLDFGISKNLSPLAGTPQGMTQTRAILGSPEYMSPEQLRTPRGVDGRTDIWSMGVILYELLTGKMPFGGDSLGELFMQIMEATPVRVTSHRPDVPAALETIVERCLVRDPNGRFQSVGELAASLTPFASDQMRALMAARGTAPGRASGQPLAATAAMMPSIATTAPPNTAAPWASTGAGIADAPAGVPSAKRSKVTAILAVSVLGVVALVGVVAVVVKVQHTEPSAASQGLTMDSTATAPAGSAAPSPSSVATAPTPDLDAGGASAKPLTRPASPPPATKPAAPPPAAKPAGGPDLAAPPPTPAPPQAAPVAPAAAAKNCSPNYYFDKDGHKHFKPECF